MSTFFSLFLLSIFAGVLTIIAPCILSLLPIMLGSSLGGGSKWRPFFVVFGMIASFAAFGFIFAASTSFLGLSREAIRNAATILILVFGLALVFPHHYDRLVAAFQAQLSKIRLRMRNGQPLSPSLPKKRDGLWGAFTLGGSMGIAWVPCAGPVLGIILTIATVEGNLIGGTILFIGYALGAAVPMLLIGYGGKWMVEKVRWLASRAETIRRVAGVILVIMGIAIFFGIDRRIETAAFDFFADTTKIEEAIIGNVFGGSEMEDMMNKPFPPTDMPVLLPDRL